MKMPLNAACAAALLTLFLSMPAAAGGFVDPLDMDAKPSAQAAKRPMRALTLVGERVVAVGESGRIVLSDDGGKSWRQARVPVTSDLNAVSFADVRLGWAVGHDGVILHTQDGGETWALQFDGRRLQSLLYTHYRRQLKDGQEPAARLIEDIGTMMQPGPASFFMDVAFENASDGIAVGKFGLILGTRDGGLSWQPLLEHLANPDYLHLNAVRRIGARTWVVGERGQVWVRDAGQTAFEAVPTDYDGGLFGITGDAQFVLVYGMRGNSLRSEDGGRHWSAVNTGIAGGLSDAAMLPGGRLVLAAQSGQLLASRDSGRSFKPLSATLPTMYAAVLGLPSGALVLAGLNGVHLQPQRD